MSRGLELPASEHPRASILIPAFHPPTLGACLESLARHLPHEPACEVVAVLNGPSDELLAAAAAAGVSGLRTVDSPVNLGLAAGCNLARAAARGEYLVLFQDDARIEAGWLEVLVEAADAHPEAGAVGGMVLWPEGDRVQTAGLVVWADGLLTSVGVDDTPAEVARAGLRAVDMCTSSSLLVRASTWDAIGGLDDDFFPTGHVDADLSVRIRRHGQLILCEPRARSRHVRGASTSRGYKLFIAVRNNVRFLARWEPALAETQEPPGERGPAEVGRALGRAAERLGGPGGLPTRAPRRTGPPFALDAPAEERLGAALEYSHRHLALRQAYEAEIEPVLAFREEEVTGLRGEIELLRVQADKLERILGGGWWRLRSRLLPLRRALSWLRRVRG